MEQTKLKALELNAAKARLYGVQMVHDAASGHPGGSMSCMDVLTYLYFAEMRVDPKNPHDPGRDRFVMSKGHCSPAMYPVLALRGFFPVEDLKMFRRIDGHMSGHVEMKYVPGVDMSTGSLGQGISVAVGMALAGKVAQKDYRVYAILGDGEVAEGQVWEAMMAANKYHLDNLCACVDVNGLQIDGETKDVMPTEPLDKKFEAFGWHVIQIDGHDFAQIEAAYQAVNRPIDNVKIMSTDIERIKGVITAEDEVSRIYINFCNPWSKNGSSHKHRLTYPRQLINYRAFLKDGGEIYFKTDDDDLFRDSLEYFPASGYDIEWMTYDLHENEPEWNIRTEHEGMFTEMGIKIKALIARKKPGDDSVTWIEPKVLKRMAREAAEAEAAAKAAQEGESNV